MDQTHYEVAIIGGGPAGLQAALMLARTSRRMVVFDAPEPPRNAASHGVHNFVGLDGLTPAEIREQAWKQIAVYHRAERRVERVVDVQCDGGNGFVITSDMASAVTARQVVLALGFRDVYPDVPGFLACWGHSIIPCPYCDGYENRDRVWGLVASTLPALEHMPHLYRNWTGAAKLIVAPALALDAAQQTALAAARIELHTGDIVAVQHSAGKVEAVTLNTGAQIAVETLWWRPEERPQPLTVKIIANFGLELDEQGYIKTDAQHQTAVSGLWAVGDVRGWAGALGAAYQASQAAVAISRTWQAEHRPDEQP